MQHWNKMHLGFDSRWLLLLYEKDVYLTKYFYFLHDSDEDSVGSVSAPGRGGKIVGGEGALDGYLGAAKLKDSMVWFIYNGNTNMCRFCVTAY